MNVKIKFTVEVGEDAGFIAVCDLTPPVIFPYDIAIILHRHAMPSHMYNVICVPQFLSPTSLLDTGYVSLECVHSKWILHAQ